MKSVKDLGLEVLVISQFTLYHRLKGNKPDFSKAMTGEAAKEMYQSLIDKLQKDYKEPTKIKDGIFGAMMEVNIVNSGPVTIEIESPTKVHNNEEPKE